MTLQVVRGWLMRCNARGLDGLINGKAPGKSSLLNDDRHAALAQAIERGPTPYFDGVVHWRPCHLAQWLSEAFRVSVSEQTLGREVRFYGLPQTLSPPEASCAGRRGGRQI
ncbi:Homeodomain-like domain protein [compost metagenome]